MSFGRAASSNELRLSFQDRGGANQSAYLWEVGGRATSSMHDTLHLSSSSFG